MEGILIYGRRGMMASARAVPVVDSRSGGNGCPGNEARRARDRDGSPAGPRLGLPRLGTQYDSPARRDRPSLWTERRVDSAR